MALQENHKDKAGKAYSKPKLFRLDLQKIDRWTCDIHFPVLVHHRIPSGRLNARLLIRLDLLTAQTKRVIRDPHDTLWTRHSRVCESIVLRSVCRARKEHIVIIALRRMLDVRFG